MYQQISSDLAATTQHGWRTIRHFAYAERPFRDVRRALAAAPRRILGDPSASTGGDAVPKTELRVRRAWLDLARDVRMIVGDVEVGVHNARLPIRWEDATHPGLFPILDATLELTPVRAGRHAVTQVGLFGRYRPPFGRLGGLADDLAGHQVAAESVEQFLHDVVDRLDSSIPVPEPGPEPDDHSRARGTARKVAGRRRIVLPVDGLERSPGGAAGLALRLVHEPGVLDATVNPKSGLAVIDYDAATTGVTRLLRLLEMQQ